MPSTSASPTISATETRWRSPIPDFEAHAGERVVHEVAQRPQAAAEHGAGAAADAHGPLLEDGERELRGEEPVAQLVGERPQALGLREGDRLVAPALVLGDGVGDGVVEAAVERVELAGGDRRVRLVGQLRDDLADVAVAVDDLAHGEAHREQLAAVQGGALLDRIRRPWPGAAGR